MAHEIEGNNAFFVGQPAWHGLGTVLDQPPTIGEAITLAGLDWSVSLQPVQTAGGIVIPDTYATVRDSDQTALGVVKSRYTILQNCEAFQWFQPFIDSGAVTLEAAGSLRNGKRIWVLAKVATATGDVTGQGDTVERYLLLSNSHDGTLLARVGHTDIRVVCANTLAAALGAGDSKLLKVRHTKGMAQTLGMIQEVIDLQNQDFRGTLDQYRTLAAAKSVTTATLDQYFRLVTKGDATRNPEADGRADRTVNTLVSLYETGRGADLSRGSWWGAYNAVTEYVTHEAGRTVDARLDSQWFGKGAELATRALEAAMGFAT